MRDTNKPILTAFITALDGKVTYNGSPVPAYDEQNPNEGEGLYIILSDMTDSDESNKARFMTYGTVLIDIVHRSGASTSYDAVNTVADGVMQILQPTINTHGLVNPTGLSICNLRRLSTNRLHINLAATENIMRRLLRYEYTITES